MSARTELTRSGVVAFGSSPWGKTRPREQYLELRAEASSAKHIPLHTLIRMRDRSFKNNHLPFSLSLDPNLMISNYDWY